MNIYLIQSSSYRLLNEEIEKITKNSSNISFIDLNNTEIGEIIEEASYLTLFGETKYLVIKNADFFASDKMKDNAVEILTNYFENPNEKTVLIFTTTKKIDSRKIITKKVKEKYKLVVIDNLKSYELIKKIEEYLQKSKYKFNKEVPKYISEVCLNNYDLIYNELEKINLYYEQGDHLVIDDIEKIISRFSEENNFKFVDAVISKNIVKSFKLFDDLKLTKAEPTIILSLLAREYRLTYHAKLLVKKGFPSIKIASKLKLQEWQVDKALKQAYDYDIIELEDALLKLAKVDLTLKSNAPDRYLPLEMFILDIAN